jgi:chromosome segregation ATPase
MIVSIGAKYEARLSELNSQIDNLKTDVTQREQTLTNTSKSLDASNKDTQKYRQIIEGASKKNGQAISNLDKKVAALADEMTKGLSEIQGQINKISIDISSLSLEKEPLS